MRTSTILIRTCLEKKALWICLIYCGKKIYTYIFFHNRLNTYFIYVCVFQLRLSELFLNRSSNIETNCNLNEWIRFGFIFSAVLSLMSWKFCRELKLPDQSNNLSPECWCNDKAYRLSLFWSNTSVKSHLIIAGRKTISRTSMVWKYNSSFIYERFKDKTRLIVVNEV